jgi:hypothetical protein
MSKAIPLEEDDVNAAFMPLDASNQIAGGSPTQSTLEAIDGFTHTIENGFSCENSNDAAIARYDTVDGHESTIAPPT